MANARPRARAQAYQRVVEAMRGRIAQGAWQPGQRLPTSAELSRELGVGLSSVREALRILGNERVVRVEHGRGIFVADAPRLPPGLFDSLSMDADTTLAALLEARRLIEPGVAGLAAVHAGAEAVGTIVEAALEMARCVEAGRDFDAPDILLHRQVALAAGNPLLGRMMDVVLDLFFESSRVTRELPEMPAKASQYHLLIAAAIAERDASRAESLMRAHIDDSIASLQRAGRLAALSRRGPGG